MNIKFTKEEKEVLHKVHLLSGKTYEEVKEVFEGFLYLSIFSYLEKEPMILPFFGELDLKFIKDTITKNGREAEIDIDFIPSKILKRTIGQIEDKEESDIEKIIMEKISNLFKKALDK